MGFDRGSIRIPFKRIVLFWRNSNFAEEILERYGWLGVKVAFFFFFLSILVKCFRKTRQTDDRKREKEGTWKKLHRRKVGRWPMIIFHSTRRSELSL